VKAPVDKPDDYHQQLSSRPLSCLPHQLRHFLSTFNTLQITGQHFPNCTACSKAILDEYAQRGWQFVRDVCLDSSLLSRISGLDQILKRRGGGGDGNRQTPGLHASDNGEEEEWDWADSESGSSASD
jgi:hypothetical protein